MLSNDAPTLGVTPLRGTEENGIDRRDDEGASYAACPLLGSVWAFASHEVFPSGGMMHVTTRLAFRLPDKRVATQLQRGGFA